MYKSILLLLLGFPLLAMTQKTTTPFEASHGTQTPTYFQIIDWWKKLDARSPLIKMQEMGPSDAGFPIDLILVSADRDFNIASIRSKKKNIILINNGIHPGEPDGIDASMLLVRDIAENRFPLPPNIVLGIIPVYNIGGCLNRSNHYRVDQNGPEAFGFRGNAENLDLNRDFIKCDSREALTFSKIFHYLDPDVFVDNHVSDGADYQHVMTLLTSQHNKLGGEMGTFLNGTFEPALYSLMKEKGFDLVPYVNHSGEIPDKGWSQFWDSPRYSTGYATLWNSFSFMPETHMLKPYAQRVAADKALMESFITFTAAHGREILDLRARTLKQQLSQNRFPISWKLDKTRSAQIDYKGYEAGHKTSGVSGLPRLYYDRSKPFESRVPFYNEYRDSLSVEKPMAYVIPQGWWKVTERLMANGVKMKRLSRDTAIKVQWYRIEGYQSGQRPYEGHHPNSQVSVQDGVKMMNFRKGDYYIPLDQAANRFLVETLEPQAEDSYFAWNFFDPILGQKEGYSDYHFEDVAAAYLLKHPELKTELDQKKSQDSSFARNADAQLNFVFQHSEYFEPDFLQYPVYRILNH
ncbi:MAG: M14 family zinc carboxypeptidase [Flavisolibacter sp.]